MIKQSIIENVLEAALATGGDFSEIFIEDKYVNDFVLQSGKIEQSITGRDFGIGIRIFSGLQSIYTYTNDFSEAGLLAAAERAALAIKGGKSVPFTLCIKKSSLLFIKFSACLIQWNTQEKQLLCDKQTLLPDIMIPEFIR